jgi:hypothetical protein
MMWRSGILARLMVALMAAGMAMAGTSCSQREAEFDYLRIVVDGQPTMAINKKDTLVRGIVVFFHGKDQDEFALTSDTAGKDMTSKLVNAGFAVVSSLAGGNAFTSTATVKNYRELASVAMQHYRIENIYLLAETMGAIPAVNLLVSDYTPVRGLAAISPVLDVRSATQDWPPLSTVTPQSQAQAGNPIDLPANLLAKKNLRFYVSPDDRYIPTMPNAAAFDEKFGHEADISIVDCSGGHDDRSCVQPDDVIRWFNDLDAKARS